MSDQVVEHHDFSSPDEVRQGDRYRAEIVNLANGPVARMILQPGWRWSEDIKPIAGTRWCEAPHQQVLITGRMHVVMCCSFRRRRDHQGCLHRLRPGRWA